MFDKYVYIISPIVMVLHTDWTDDDDDDDDSFISHFEI